MFDEDDQNLGYHRPNYAAQTMFGAYRSGMDFSGLGQDGLGFVSDMNQEEDQSFDPTEMAHLNGMPDFGAVAPVAQPSSTTARRNEEDRTGNQPVPPEEQEEVTGSVWGAAIGGAVTLVLGITGSLVQSAQAKKSAEAQMALNKSQTEANLAEAERLRAQAEVDRANSLPWGTIIAGGTVVVAVGAAAFLLREKKRKSE